MRDVKCSCDGVYYISWERVVCGFKRVLSMGLGFVSLI